MDLSKEELSAIKSQNQRVKALLNGTVSVLWKDGKIEKIFVNAEVTGNIYGAEQKTSLDAQG